MWLSEDDLKTISQRARHGSRYLSRGENRQLMSKDIPRLITEIDRLKGTLRPLVTAAGYTDTDDKGFWKMVNRATAAVAK